MVICSARCALQVPNKAHLLPGVSEIKTMQWYISDTFALRSWDYCRMAGPAYLKYNSYKMAADKIFFAYVHGEILPLNQAFLHVSDLAIQRGYGVFDFFRIQEGCPLFLDDYLHRFYQSAQIMHLPVPLEPGALKTIIYKLIRLNDLPVAGMKIILTGGYSSDGYNPTKPNLIISQQAVTLPDQTQLENGIKIITHEYGREIPEAKTINYTMGIQLGMLIKEQAAADVLYFWQEKVLEFPRANFFILTPDNTIITPAQGILPGITRKNVLALTRDKYNSRAGVITLNDVLQAKEAFLTSTTKRIIPIVQVNQNLIGNGKPGPVTRSLLQDLILLEEKQVKAMG